MVSRAMQLICYKPKGPAYAIGAREVLAKDVRPVAPESSQFTRIGPSALPEEAVPTIVNALVSAQRPLIITGYSSRNPVCPP